MVWLSVASAATPTPMLPLAPVRFSTTTVVLSSSLKGLEMMRAMASDVPPGANGMMIFSVCVGHAVLDAGCAVALRPLAASEVAAVVRKTRRRFSMVAP